MCACMYRRKTSVIPEIRVVAPSLERGLDEDIPYVLHSPSISQSPIISDSLIASYSAKIYRSYDDDDTHKDSSRYMFSKHTCTSAQYCTLHLSSNHLICTSTKNINTRLRISALTLFSLDFIYSYMLSFKCFPLLYD